jgi:hypothetical protein
VERGANAVGRSEPGSVGQGELREQPDLRLSTWPATFCENHYFSQQTP